MNFNSLKNINFNNLKVWFIVMTFLLTIQIVLFIIIISGYKIEKIQLKEQIRLTEKKYMEVYQENIMLKEKEKIIQNIIKDEILQGKIKDNLDRVTDAMEFFTSPDTSFLQR